MRSLPSTKVKQPGGGCQILLLLSVEMSGLDVTPDGLGLDVLLLVSKAVEEQLEELGSSWDSMPLGPDSTLSSYH